MIALLSLVACAPGTIALGERDADGRTATLYDTGVLDTADTGDTADTEPCAQIRGWTPEIQVYGSVGNPHDGLLFGCGFVSDTRCPSDGRLVLVLGEDAELTLTDAVTLSFYPLAEGETVCSLDVSDGDLVVTYSIRMTISP